MSLAAAEDNEQAQAADRTAADQPELATPVPQDPELAPTTQAPDDDDTYDTAEDDTPMAQPPPPGGPPGGPPPQPAPGVGPATQYQVFQYHGLPPSPIPTDS